MLNRDIQIKPAGRNALIVSEDFLAQQMEKAAIKAGETRMTETMPWHLRMQCIISTLHESVLCDDNKYNISCENIIVNAPGEDNLLGFKTLSNGLTFFGYKAGGDWGNPAFMIVYWDGKKLRSYTPTRGNLINVDFGCALGDEEVYADEKLVEKIMRKYKKEGWQIGEKQARFLEDAADIYCQYNDEILENIQCDWVGISEDIVTHITPSHEVPKHTRNAVAVHKSENEKTPLQQKYKSVKKLFDMWLSARKDHPDDTITLVIKLNDGQRSMLAGNWRGVIITGFVPESIQKWVRPDGDANVLIRDYIKAFDGIAVDAEICM